MDDKDRTIRIQQNMLEQHEKDKNKPADLITAAFDAKSIETTTCATQTERVSSTLFREILEANDSFTFFLAASGVNGTGKFHKVISFLSNQPHHDRFLKLSAGLLWAFRFTSPASCVLFRICLPIEFLTIFTSESPPN